MTHRILTKSQKGFILAGAMLSMFLGALDSTIVGTAMPRVINELKGMELYTWPFTIYVLCMAVAMPIFGKLADSFGFKPLFITGILYGKYPVENTRSMLETFEKIVENLEYSTKALC